VREEFFFDLIYLYEYTQNARTLTTALGKVDQTRPHFARIKRRWKGNC